MLAVDNRVGQVLRSMQQRFKEQFPLVQTKRSKLAVERENAAAVVVVAQAVNDKADSISANTVDKSAHDESNEQLVVAARPARCVSAPAFVCGSSLQTYFA